MIIVESLFPDPATSHRVALPDVERGDLLLLLWTSQGSDQLTDPSGWGRLYRHFHADKLRACAYRKVAIGDEGGTLVDIVTDTPRVAVAQVYRFPGWSGVIADVKSSPIGEGANSASPLPGALMMSFSAPTTWIGVAHTSGVRVLDAPQDYGSSVRTLVPMAGLASAARNIDLPMQQPSCFELERAAWWLAFTLCVPMEHKTVH